MPCYHPITAWVSKFKDSRGKSKVVFQYPSGYEQKYDATSLPCGRCIGCRLDKSLEWAIRLVHEEQIHREEGKDSYFITLTYSPEELPEHGGLVKEDFQKFMKRLRKEFPNDRIRYLHCGEYGDKNDRPHYHAIIFGITLPDLLYHKHNNDYPLFTSELLQRTWKKGYCWVGAVTFETCAYVARYITKKISDPNCVHTLEQAEAKKEYIKKYMVKEGDYAGYLREAEYITMSRGGRTKEGQNLGGIGKRFLDKYYKDIYTQDLAMVRGVNKKISRKPPKYYDSKFDIIDHEKFLELKERRKLESKENEVKDQRLAGKELAKITKMKRLERTYENGKKII